MGGNGELDPSLRKAWAACVRHAHGCTVLLGLGDTTPAWRKDLGGMVADGVGCALLGRWISRSVCV